MSNVLRVAKHEEVTYRVPTLKQLVKVSGNSNVTGEVIRFTPLLVLLRVLVHGVVAAFVCAAAALSLSLSLSLFLSFSKESWRSESCDHAIFHLFS